MSASGSGDGTRGSGCSGCLVTVKWGAGEPLVVPLGQEWETQPLHVLVTHLSRLSEVPGERMKLLGGKVKGSLTQLTADEQKDIVTLGEFLRTKPAPPGTDINYAAVANLIMMGTVDANLLAGPPIPLDEAGFQDDVINDLDPDYYESLEGQVPLWEKPENQAKLARAIARAEVAQVEGVHAGPRPGRKCLVLDVDYTFFDHRSVAERPQQLQRPFLHEFLAGVYEHYDIILWSATSQKWIDEKMKGMGVYGHPHYKIAFCLNYSGMFTVHNTSGKTSKVVHDVKPLEVLWAKYPGVYSRENTIMFDDLARNMAMNPQNGLRIRAFRNAHLNRDTDQELPRLLRYLRLIAEMDSFSTLKHRKWERFVEKRGGFGDFLAQLPQLQSRNDQDAASQQHPN